MGRRGGNREQGPEGELLGCLREEGRKALPLGTLGYEGRGRSGGAGQWEDLPLGGKQGSESPRKLASQKPWVGH